MKKKAEITEDMLNRYVTGTASLDEIAMVAAAIKEDNSLRDVIEIMENLNRNGALLPDDDIPMASSAAMAEDNLCDVMCEQYILKEYLGEKAFEDCVDQMLDNCWLKESGTPLHNMGHLLERHGLPVVRKYDSNVEELDNLLKTRNKTIAVVDYGQLWNGESDGIFHAVVCLSIVNGVLRIFDPAVDGFGNYLIQDFDKAWAYSRHYVVYASPEGLEYTPHPIDVSSVDLDEELMELSEAIAENAHEVWAQGRYNEGWRYGEKRDDEHLLHPDMIPYSELPEGEKYYDRAMAFNTIRLVKKLGFTIGRRYTLYCQHCGEFVADEMNYCPNCGSKIEKRP